jgi:hypothetical protein
MAKSLEGKMSGESLPLFLPVSAYQVRPKKRKVMVCPFLCQSVVRHSFKLIVLANLLLKKNEQTFLPFLGGFVGNKEMWNFCFFYFFWFPWNKRAWNLFFFSSLPRNGRQVIWTGSWLTECFVMCGA